MTLKAIATLLRCRELQLISTVHENAAAMKELASAKLIAPRLCDRDQLLWVLTDRGRLFLKDIEHLPLPDHMPNQWEPRKVAEKHNWRILPKLTGDA